MSVKSRVRPMIGPRGGRGRFLERRRRMDTGLSGRNMEELNGANAEETYEARGRREEPVRSRQDAPRLYILFNMGRIKGTD